MRSRSQEGTGGHLVHAASSPHVVWFIKRPAMTSAGQLWPAPHHTALAPLISCPTTLLLRSASLGFSPHLDLLPKFCLLFVLKKTWAKILVIMVVCTTYLPTALGSTYCMSGVILSVPKMLTHLPFA